MVGAAVILLVVVLLAAVLAWQAMSRKAALPPGEEAPADPLHEQITCHECGQRHSALETSCPHCGRPREPEQTP